MANFHHHPDGWVYVRTDAGVYVDTPENFGVDFGQPYNLDGRERYYEPGVRHHIDDLPEPLDWPQGDAYIAAYNSLAAAQAARLTPAEPGLEQQRLAALARVDDWAARERARWRTPNMSETYAQKQLEVDTWRRIIENGGAATVADAPYAARRAARKNGLAPDQLDQVTPEMLAAVIGEYEAAIAFLRVKDLDIEDTREAAKEAIAVATTAAEIAAVLAGF